ncbi:MAG: phage tail spike protein, partial [Acutalibacteraceae bacterium]|nr:phage tail spike protein [Acutalibacteraceae bacterium]
MPFTSTSVTDAFLQIKNKCVEQDDFTYWTDKTSSGTMKITAPRSVRAALGGSEGSILDSFGGGDYEWDGFTVKLWTDRGFDKGVTLRYGKNITDIKQEWNIENTVTGIVPFWIGNDSEGTETVVTLTEEAVYAQNSGNYPYARTIPIDFSEKFQSQPTEAQLRSAAQSYITSNKIGVPPVSIDVSFVPLWQTEEYKNIANLERVNLCDTVTVEFEKLGISAKAKVIKTEYNVLKDRYDSISLGDARTSFSDSISEKISSTANAIKQSIPKESVFRQIVNEQTQKITGGLGGHVVMTLNANDEPQEILIMDTDDVQTAVNVIRINWAGIGFSTNGYNGPFQSAWTIDGLFNADFIATGHLLANFIQGGTLAMGGANNGNGVIEVYDSNGTLIGRWDNSGLSATGNLIIKLNENATKYVIAQAGSQSIIDPVTMVTDTTDAKTYYGFVVRQRGFGSGNTDKNG